MKKTLVVFVALTLLFGLGSGGWVMPTDREPVLKASYSAVPLQDEAKAEAQKQGINVTGHLPAHLEKGPHALNSNNTVGVNPIGSEQKAIALYLKFPANADDPSDIVPATDGYEPMDVSYLQDLLFGDSYNPYQIEQFAQYANFNGTAVPTDRTLKNYYKEVSYGAANVSGQVVEVNMPQAYSYYAVGKQYGHVQNDYGDFTMAKMFSDAVEAAAEQVDFAQYADANGNVPNVFLIHPGTGAEWNLDPNVIWSHSWSYNEAYAYMMYAETGDASWLSDAAVDPDNVINVDGVKVNNYSIEPEVGGDITAFLGAKSGPFPPTVGVYVHEFGHVLGVPDQYDYGYDSEGTGYYSLMAGGSWARYPNARQYSGNSPVHLDVWSKTYLGFAEPQVLTNGEETYTLRPSAVYPDAVKIVVPGSGGSEYFLLENRQQTGFDNGFSRFGTGVKGLEIYHVDENVIARNFWRPNEAQNWFQSRKQNPIADPSTGETHYGMAIVQADNRFDLERNRNAVDAGDLYKTGMELTPTSTPNSGSYYFNEVFGGRQNYTGIYVTNILENQDGSITFTAGFEE